MAAVHLCLGGGNALGAYVAGAVEGVVAAGIEPDVVSGVSVGAVIGAIFAGNAPAERLPRLREFWQFASARALPVWPGTGGLRHSVNGLHALTTLAAGRPGLFRPRWPGLLSLMPGMPPDVALFDGRPMAASLQRFVDFELLHREGPRLVVETVDVETGAAVRIDSRQEPITPDVLLAATGLPPGFPPVRVKDRWLADAGLICNVPLDLALHEAQGARTVIAVDPFPATGPRPTSLDASAERAQDLMFSAQTQRTIEAFRRECALRADVAAARAHTGPGAGPRPGPNAGPGAGPGARPDAGPPTVNLVLATYQPPHHETGGKTLDFSEQSVRDRWAAGLQDMSALLAELAQARPADGGDGLHLFRRAPASRPT